VLVLAKRSQDQAGLKLAPGSPEASRARMYSPRPLRVLPYFPLFCGLDPWPPLKPCPQHFPAETKSAPSVWGCPPWCRQLWLLVFSVTVKLKEHLLQRAHQLHLHTCTWEPRPHAGVSYIPRILSQHFIQNLKQVSWGQKRRLELQLSRHFAGTFVANAFL
jgi:hypothetical protein